MNALIFAVADDIALRLGARHHLFHVAAADTLQRCTREYMDMPGLGVHRRRGALGDLDDPPADGARHRLFLEAAHAAAGLHQCLKVHFSHPQACPSRSVISSQPSGFTLTRSPMSTSTVVVSASMIAGPSSECPGNNA